MCIRDRVCTALTACELCVVGELVYLVDGEHCCLVISLMALACDESGTKGTHDTCDIRQMCIRDRC